MKRKGFMSLEMLLVIGVIVAGLAGVFAVYKKIQANNASMQVTQDLAAIVNGLDRFKGATGGYPVQGTPEAKINSTNNTSTWNESNLYVAQDIGSKWGYHTEIDGTIDTVTGTGTGNVIVTVEPAKYAALNTVEIRDILRGKCLNGMKQVGTSGKITTTQWRCVIASNVILFDAGQPGQ